ncbi:hypothetical protein E6Q11_01475 [Candidatus Dojkabacteria bacterium]|uniref:Uncharacterized protein n=1 Tax=Candidatus Dojkabacteria bacterium TaxID=2099670 RepID=A0A5C7J9V5_9BACT|nr:MAG: hypothetical protein E6Q11_01475 [Candidatus Dojkabacteria bacterium]
MNITKLNFNSMKPKIIELIRSSHFVSLDLEMSGIISPSHPENDPSLTDSVLPFHIGRFKPDTLRPNSASSSLSLSS